MIYNCIFCSYSVVVMASRKPVNLKKSQKLELCLHQQANPSINQQALAQWAKEKFQLQNAPSQGAISNILSKRRELDSLTDVQLETKRSRAVANPQLDQALANWVLQCEGRHISLSGDLIKEKASCFARNLKINDGIEYSNGWLDRFQKRYGFKGFKSYGESGSVDLTVIEEKLPELQEKLSAYAHHDIYNMDETGLFFRMAPDRSISQRQIEGMKKDKSRFTIAFCANADGTDKLQPFFIGHALIPRCFQKKSAAELGFYYRNNTKAWMTGLFFREWLEEFDKKMRSTNRHVLLLLDNAPSHATGDLVLTHTNVLMLPPNTTSKIQPMDAGIIAAFKRRYRRFQLRDAIDKDEHGIRDIYKVDQLRAMRWALAAWNDITDVTICNCFKHTKLIDDEMHVLDEGNAQNDANILTRENEIDQEIVQAITSLRVSEPMALHLLLNPDAENAAAHQVFTDEDFLEIALDNTEVDPEEQEEEEKLLPNKQTKLLSLRNSISLLDMSKPSHAFAYEVLRSIQSDIRSSGIQQSTLDSWIVKPP